MRSAGLLLLACLVGLAPAARADAIEEFYRGRSMTLIVSSGVGGGYDTYGRMLARTSRATFPASRTSSCRTCRAPAA